MQTSQTDTLWSQNSYVDGILRNNNITGTVGAAYEIAKNHDVGVRIDLKASLRDDTRESNSISDIYTDRVLYDTWENRELKETRNKLSPKANLYYMGKIGKLGIDFNADYYNESAMTNGVNIESSQKFGQRGINSNRSIENSLLAGKLQFTHPIWKGELTIGGEYIALTRGDSYINNDLPDFTSRVDVNETNLVMFAEYHLPTAIGNFRLGVRYDDAAYRYMVDGNIADDKSRHYRDFFPNFSYSTKLSKVSIQFNYTSKVVRPSYSELSNNLTYLNRLSFEIGNPFLKPTIRQDLSLMLVWKILQASVRYAHSENEIVTWIDHYDKDPKVSVLTSRNIDRLPKFAAILTAAPTFGIWKPQLSLGIQKQWLDLNNYGVDANLDRPILFASIFNMIELPKGFIVNVDLDCQRRGDQRTVYIYKDNFMLNCGISKSLFKGAMQIRLAINDIFNQGITAYQIVMPGAEFKNLYHHDNRKVSLTIRCNFNSTRSKYNNSMTSDDALRRFK